MNEGKLAFGKKPEKTQPKLVKVRVKSEFEKMEMLDDLWTYIRKGMEENFLNEDLQNEDFDCNERWDMM